MVIAENRTYLNEEYKAAEPQRLQGALGSMGFDFGSHKLYMAGLPGYARFFTRDSIITGQLTKDTQILASALTFADERQAKVNNPVNAAEPGKIIHEYDVALGGGVELAGRFGNTEYNSCDTTALYIQGHETYFGITGDVNFVKRYEPSIISAGKYIAEHVNDKGHFIEDPAFSGAKNFALKVTYWKDSVLPGRAGGEPSYPVIYTLAHAQNAAALRSQSKLTGLKEPAHLAQKMVDSLPALYDSKKKTFHIAVDSDGPISGVSSDSLHMLSYLKPGDLPPDIIEDLVRSAQVLETEWGYRTLEPELSELTDDPYHTTTVWPHEQANMLMGILDHLEWANENGFTNAADALGHAAEVSFRPNKYFQKNPDSFTETILNGKASGCHTQLWVIGARKAYLNVEPRYRTAA